MLFISSISSDNEASHSAKYLLKQRGVKLEIKIIKLLHARTIGSHENAPLINNIFDFLASDFVEV